MKTIELKKHTGEYETITETVDGEQVTWEQEILETANSYTCEDGQENDLLRRARLTAELWTRDTGFQHDARIKEE